MSERWPVVSRAPTDAARASPGCARLGRAAVERVQQRRVGAVEAHERPRERTVERMRAQRLRHPRRVLDHALGRDVDHLGRGLAGLGVVLERRHEHPPAGGAHADDLAVAQAGEERTDHRPDAAPVRELQLPRGRHGQCVTARRRVRAKSPPRAGPPLAERRSASAGKLVRRPP